MPGRALLRVARGALGVWLLGGFWVWALGGLCGLGAAAPGAGAGGSPSAQRPCQAPQQWEGRQVLYRQSTGRYSRALLSYDGLNQRVRVLDERKALIPCKRYVDREAWGSRAGEIVGAALRRGVSSHSRRLPPIRDKLGGEGRLETASQRLGPPGAACRRALSKTQRGSSRGERTPRPTFKGC